MKRGKVMQTALVISLISVAIIGGIGVYLYSKIKLKNINSNPSPRLPNNTNKLDAIINTYEQNCLHYYIFAWGNHKRISIEVENQLRAKYPLVLALPILELSEHFPNQKDEQRKAVLAYLKQYDISVDDWTPETSVLKTYIQQKAEQKAEQIVNTLISQ